MAGPVTADEFVDLVRKSELVEADRLDVYLCSLRECGQLPAEPFPLAELLIRDGLLTCFQTEQLLQGKWRPFTLFDFRVLERLSAGASTSVYLCERLVSKRRVAMQILPAHLVADAASRERFLRKARAMGSLEHRNTVRLLECGERNGLLYLVMEHVDGTNLKGIVKSGGPLGVARAAHYVDQAALGLQAIHERGLVHRNVKPKHLLLSREGIVKVTGLGLVRQVPPEEVVVDAYRFRAPFLGTPDFVSPEQAVDSHYVDTRTDVYALGATLYLLLTGQPPMGEGTAAQKLIWHQTRAPVPIRSLHPEVPEELARVITKMMAKDPARRHQHAREVAEALSPWTQTPVAPPPEWEMPQLSPAARGEPRPA
jgi:serine/threonine protein kinase